MNNDILLEATDSEMRNYLNFLSKKAAKDLREMIIYHFGWNTGNSHQGKKIRPLLLLLSCSAAGGAWEDALPAAASVEFLHNFSLIIDDVEDKSELRRGMPTIWTKWGISQGINTGNTIFVLANMAMANLRKFFPVDMTLKAMSILNSTCLEMTTGQSLDLLSEKQNIDINTYWEMIGGKTSALLSACTQIGALLGTATDEAQENYRQFGVHLGLAFQVQDDILGIWGDETVTGKSAASDLVEGKNSLPVLYALARGGKFADRWNQGPIKPEEVRSVAALLDQEGGHEYAEEISRQETGQALSFLEEANPQGKAGEALLELANKLLNREQ